MKALHTELDAWAAAGRKPVFWWRDDDATADLTSLRRLLDLREASGLPLALAVIPALIEESLPPLLAGQEGLCLLQHGYAHQNHAPPDRKKRELGDERPLDAVLAELKAGKARGEAFFGAAWLPILVPPWNRIAPAVAAALPGLGFTGLSTHGRAPTPPPGLLQVNSHLDIMEWKPRARFRGEGAVLDNLCAELAARREDEKGLPVEPLGLLTHHLAHDEAAWNFLEKLLSDPHVKEMVSWKPASGLFSRHV